MSLSKKRKDDAASKNGKEESRYIRMVKAVFKVCQRQRVPLYLSRFSRHDYTLWQHIALVMLMQRIRKSYREYVDDYLTTTEKLLDAPGPLKEDTSLHHDREVPHEGARHPARERHRWVPWPHEDQVAGLLS
jgi:hypothetical protein